LQATRAEGAVNLVFSARVALPRAVDDALQKGVPLYFVAEATLLRNRWYWRDERVARLSRSWRLAFQPLTGAWRVSLGGLHHFLGNAAHHFGSFADAQPFNRLFAEPNILVNVDRYRHVLPVVNPL
jgi:hypothetical protein